MLNPDIIPTSEPIIRVGVVMAEDNFQTVAIEIPETPDYIIVNSKEEKSNVKVGDVVEIKYEKDQCALFINDKAIATDDVWKIIPNDDIEMSNKAGLKIKEVVSGRGFHWQKNIEVFVSGTVEVKTLEGNLCLINELPIEEYLMCVATSEMGRECPKELIESQTIAARSWMLANVEQKHVPHGFDVCNDDCCQRYQGTTHLSKQSIIGAMNTHGLVLMYKQQICDARYSKSCGGVMETFENIWEDTPLDYMQPIPDAPKDFQNPNLPLDTETKVEEWINSVPNTFCSPHAISEKELKRYLGSVDEEGSYFRWEFYFTQKKITDLMNKKLNLGADNIVDISPVKRGESGRLTEIKIVYLQKGEKKEYNLKDQYYIRQAFHESFLYSSAFIIEKDDKEIPDYFELRGSGWGHGAGYCQIGAVGMALKGYATDEILYHYFPGSKLEQIYK